MPDLPDRYYKHDVDGRRIPHHINPGPAVACGVCGLARAGADFVRDGTCVYCESAGRTVAPPLDPEFSVSATVDGRLLLTFRESSLTGAGSRYSVRLGAVAAQLLRDALAKALEG